MQVGLFEILGLVAAIQLFILSLYLITLKKGKQLNNRLLAVFLFCNALVLLDVLQLHSGLFLKFPHLVTAGFSTSLLFGPILYFYTSSACQREFQLNKYHYLHALPYLLHWMALLPVFFLKNAPEKIRMINSGFIFTSEISVLGYTLIHVHIIVYLVASLVVLYRYHDSFNHLNWLKLILGGFLIMWFGDLVLFLTSETIPLPSQIGAGFQLLAIILYFIFVNIAVYYGLKEPNLFHTGKLKYANSALTDEERTALISRLDQLMETREPYLLSSITIDNLAEDLAVAPRYLSQAINETHDQNFIDFINRYRIDKAKSLLSNGEDPKKTILEVMYEVGFNSKSAFNKAFKKHTGYTPSVFKKQYT